MSGDDAREQAQAILKSRWKWMTATLCILAFLFGYICGLGGPLLYIGPDIAKYDRAKIGVLLK